jgi:hypothetical protein
MNAEQEANLDEVIRSLPHSEALREIIEANIREGEPRLETLHLSPNKAYSQKVSNLRFRWWEALKACIELSASLSIPNLKLVKDLIEFVAKIRQLSQKEITREQALVIRKLMTLQLDGPTAAQPTLEDLYANLAGELNERDVDNCLNVLEELHCIERESLKGTKILICEEIVFN